MIATKHTFDEVKSNLLSEHKNDANCAKNLVIDIEREMLTSEGKTTLKIATEVGEKEFRCLFGHSGSGKTTLMRMLAGLTQPSKGFISFNQQVWFDSEKKINLPPQKRNVGYMFQDYALFPNMSVRKNIEFAQREQDSCEVDKLLHLFGLDNLQKQFPLKLSGGQKQRVALARALASQPQLLLLDEPLSALDYEMRLSLQDEIAKAHQLLGSITLMVTHDLKEMKKLSSSVMLLRNGKVVNEGKTDDILKKLSF